MAEAEDENTDSVGIPDGQGGEDVPLAQQDWLLKLFVAHANRGLSIGISVYVGGTVVTGNLISASEYFKQLADNMEEGFSRTAPDTGKAIAEAFRSASKTQAERWENEEEDEELPVNYIHLADARIFVPGQPPQPTNGSLWRGLLARVDGFAPGKITPTPE